MSSPVDLTNLREITDGDKEMEAELFREFISSCDNYISDLGNMLDSDKNEVWRTTAHAFKGISVNLGAAHLGELCKKAQERNTASVQEKTILMEDIKNAYAEVKEFLQKSGA